MAKTNRSVVRNQAYLKSGFNVRERHNERKNESYGNGDIVPERSDLNVHFKRCEGTYEQEFNRMVESGAVSLRGLKANAKVFDELVFDVNTAYFENHGGYEYAKKFFAEAYRLAVKEAGGEQYVLSAVLHADERNTALSDKLGRDVYHYHLHVVYIPVVEKKVFFRKNNKNPELAGKLKEVVTQVSHSKKWPRATQTDEHGEVIRNAKGKAILVNSYSLLQDRFYEHMQAAGFTGFERGELGSTEENLSTLDYKIKKSRERLATLNAEIQEKQEQLSDLERKIAVRKKSAATFDEIDGMEKKTVFGKIELSHGDWKKLSGLAKQGITSDVAISDMQKRLNTAEKDRDIYKARTERNKAKTEAPPRSEQKQPVSIRAALRKQGQPEH